MKIKSPRLGSFAFLFLLVLGLAYGCQPMLVKGVVEKIPRGTHHGENIPKGVMETLKARFPKAEITKWTMEKEGKLSVYDIEFTQEGRKFEADIKEDGSIQNWEQAVEAKDLPQAVSGAVEKKYPKFALKEVMAITAVKDKQEALEGYEIVLETAEGKEVEVTVAPEGKFLEASEKKKGEATKAGN